MPPAEKVRQRGGTRIDPVAKLCAVAGRLADAVGLPGFALRADMTGAVLLNYLQCCTENTFTYDTAAPTPSQLSQATTGGDIVDCSWAVAVLAGRRLLVAYNADRERQAQAACELLQAEAEAERKKQAGGTAQNGGGDGSKANKKGNKKKKKAKEKKAGAGGSGVRPQLDSCMEEAVVEGGVDADDGDSPDAVQIEDSAHSMEMGSAIDSPRAAQADVDATLTGEVVCEGERSEAPTGVISADGELDSDPATTAAEMPNGACEPPNDAACNVEPESEESTESEMAAAAAAGEASVAGADDAKPPLPDPPAERSDRRKGGKKSKGKQRQQVLEPAPVEEPTVVEHSVTVAAEEDKAKPVVTLREEAKPLVPAAEVEAAELVGDAEEPAAVHLPEPETEADVVVESASCTEPSACEAAPAVALSAPDALEPPPSPREAEVDVAELLLENDAPSDSDALSALSDEDAAPAIEPATGDEAAEGREPSEPEHPLPYDLRALKVHPSNYFSALHTPGPLPVHPHLCPVYLYPGIPYDALTLARCGVAIPVSIGCNAPYAQPGVGVSLSTASSTTSAAEPASQEGDPLGQAHAAAPTSVEVLEPTLEEPAPEAAQQAEMEAESAVPEPGRACEMIRPLVEVRELPPPPGQQGFDMDAAIAFFERRSRELNEMLAQYRSTQQASDADVGEDQAVGGFVAEKEPVSGIELQGGAEPDAVPEPVFDVEVQEVAAVELRASAVVANNDGAPQVEEWCGSFDDRERSRHSSRASSLSSGREEGQPSSWQLGGPRRRRHQQYRNGNNGPVTEFGGVDAASERWPSRNDRSKSGGRGRGNGAKVAVRQQSGAPGRSGDWRIQARV